MIPLRAAQEFYGVEATADSTIDERVAIGGLFTHQRGEIFDEELGRFIEWLWKLR